MYSFQETQLPQRKTPYTAALLITCHTQRLISVYKAFKFKYCYAMRASSNEELKKKKNCEPLPLSSLALNCQVLLQ